ncbi:twin-arginine translocase subunit TatC [Humidisolicoccus flavus]|uniref:twin-arginine translocase subunit TatC n=1 Tax=Humidisolicoccus flavus TaxID=3111414 RepID=UPI003244BD75
MARAERAENAEKKMPLGVHLREARKRFVICLLAIAATSIAGFFAAPFVIHELRAPLEQLAQDGRPVNLNYQVVTESFDIRMRIGFLLGIVAASPVWLYQILRFFVPGLKHRERAYVFGFLGAAVPLFLGGCYLGWMLLPRITSIFVGFGEVDLAAFLSASSYFDFSSKLVLAIGVAFVLPVFVVILNFAGAMSGKTIMKGWRWAIIGVTLFTAFVTPAGDIMSMFVIAIPMWLIFFAAAGIALFNDWLRARRERKREAEPAL